jgi:Gpi18-like mannosyltransferase
MKDFFSKIALKTKLSLWQVKFFTIAGGLYIYSLILLPTHAHFGDRGYWVSWAGYIYEYGFCHIYKNGSNDYLPFYHYILWIYVSFCDSLEAISKNANMLKMVTYLFHLGSSYYLCACIYHYTGKTNHLWKTGFYLLNLAVLYNTLLWGQVDEILSFLLLACFYFAIKKSWVKSSIFFVLAMNMKLQAIIFLPIWILSMTDKPNLKTIFKTICIILITQCMILAPFYSVGDLPRVYERLTNFVDKYPMVSMNAFNMWYWIYDDPSILSDQTKFLGFSLKSIGMFIFFLWSGILLLFTFYTKHFLQDKDWYVKRFWNILVQIPLVFFFFNTQMHERYIHYGLIFCAIYAVLYHRYWILGLLSFAYLFNLDNIIRMLTFQNYGVAWLDPRFLAGVYAVVLYLLVYDFFQKKSKMIGIED